MFAVAVEIVPEVFAVPTVGLDPSVSNSIRAPPSPYAHVPQTVMYALDVWLTVITSDVRALAASAYHNSTLVAALSLLPHLVNVKFALVTLVTGPPLQRAWIKNLRFVPVEVIVTVLEAAGLEFVCAVPSKAMAI